MAMLLKARFINGQGQTQMPNRNLGRGEMGKVVRNMKTKVAQLGTRRNQINSVAREWERIYNALKKKYTKLQEENKTKLDSWIDKHNALKEKHKFYLKLYRNLAARYCSEHIPDRLIKGAKSLDKVGSNGALPVPDPGPSAASVLGQVEAEEEEHRSEMAGEGEEIEIDMGEGEYYVPRNVQVALPRRHGRPPHAKKLCLCGQRFKSDSAFEDHLMEKVRGLFVCDICGERFHKSATVIQHRLRIHNSFKPYPCTGCKKFFRSKDEVKLHKMGRNGKKGCKGRRIRTGVGYASVRVPNEEDFVQRVPEPDMDDFA